MGPTAAALALALPPALTEVRQALLGAHLPLQLSQSLPLLALALAHLLTHRLLEKARATWRYCPQHLGTELQAVI